MGKDKKNKQPTFKEVVSTNKQPKIGSDPQDYYQKNPAWRISKMEFVDPFGWHILDVNKVLDIQKKLIGFESMTWREILVDSRKQNHTVSVESLCKQARDRLTEIDLDDLDELTSLRLSGAERVWGILDQGIMNLLWWDPDHQVYPVEKKNT